MQWLPELFKTHTNCQGVIGISFLAEGIAVAVSNYTENNGIKLVYCEFIESKKAAEQPILLKKWLATHKLNHYDCHLVLAIDHYRRVNIEAPPVLENEIASAIRWQITELIDFPIEDAIIDYYPVPVFRDHNATLEVIVSPGYIIKPQIAQCIQAGLSLKVIDIQETTLRNLAVLLLKNQLGTAVLYLQKSLGMILIQKSGVIYLVRNIVIGYEKLDLDNPVSADSQAIELQDNLALEIQRSLDYVENYYGIYTISELAVIPWSTHTQNLVDNLNNNYGLAAYIMDLADTISCDFNLDYATQSLCAPVIGATLRNSIALA